MNNKIIIIGTGGHAKSVIDVIESTNDWEIIGLIGLKNDLNKSLLGYKVLGTDHDLESIRKVCINSFIAGYNFFLHSSWDFCKRSFYFF